MATHSSVLAWRILGTGKPGGLLSVGLHRVKHDRSDLAAAAAGTSLMIQWLRLRAFSAEVAGPILGQATKIPLAAQHSQKSKVK